jgi:hypothetical protein
MPVPVADAPTDISADAPTATVPVQAAAAGGSEWLEWRRLGMLAGAGVLLIAVLAVTGVLTDGGGPAASAGSQSPSAHVASAADSSTVRVRPSRYIGESYPTARRQLLQLGLVPLVSGDAGAPAATVTAVSPIGQVKLGHTVTLTVLPAVVGPPAHAKPKAPHSPPGHKAKPIPPGHEKHGKTDSHHGPGEGGD